MAAVRFGRRQEVLLPQCRLIEGNRRERFKMSQSAAVSLKKTRAPKTRQIGRTVNAVLDTAAVLLQEVGYRGLTTELISSRSGVARSTIYRHWPNVAELALASFERSIGPAPDAPDLGDIRSDLIFIYERFSKMLRDDVWGSVLPSLIEAAQSDQQFADLLKKVVHERRETIRSVFTRSIERGEIFEDSKIEFAIDALTGAFYHRLLITGEDVGEEMMAEWLVDSVLSQMLCHDSGKATSSAPPKSKNQKG